VPRSKGQCLMTQTVLHTSYLALCPTDERSERKPPPAGLLLAAMHPHSSYDEPTEADPSALLLPPL
jgi:hypothetical protein